MDTTTRHVFQRLDETFRTTTPQVTSILWGQGECLTQFNLTLFNFNALSATLTGFWIIYHLHHIGITRLGDKVDVFLFIFSSEVFRLNLEQGRFLNSLQTDAV